MSYDRPLHPVVRQNMESRKPQYPHFVITVTDEVGNNPALILYKDHEPTIADLARAARHYATLIFAMPREVRANYKRSA